MASHLTIQLARAHFHPLVVHQRRTVTVRSSLNSGRPGIRGGLFLFGGKRNWQTDQLGEAGHQDLEQLRGAIEPGAGSAAVGSQIAAAVDLDLQRVDVVARLAVTLDDVAAGIRRVERDAPSGGAGDARRGGGDVGGGGGAVFVRGGQLKVLDSRFTSNVCDSTGPDLGGGGLRVLSQYQGRAVIVAGSTFADNTCSNGAAISSIGVSWRIYNSRFARNAAIGSGANPSRSGTPGGGSGGAIYLDGNTFTLDLAGSTISDSTANEGGGAIFFVSNDRTGVLRITSSLLERNLSRGFATAGFPGIFFLGSGSPIVSGSTIS